MRRVVRNGKRDGFVAHSPHLPVLFQGCYNGPNRPPARSQDVRPTQYAWDGENRLIEVKPILPAATDKKATFGYDYLGRRVQRQVFGRNANNTAGIGKGDITYCASALRAGRGSSA